MAVACLSCDEDIRILTHVGELVEGTLEFIDRKMSESGYPGLKDEQDKNRDFMTDYLLPIPSLS